MGNKEPCICCLQEKQLSNKNTQSEKKKRMKKDMPRQWKAKTRRSRHPNTRHDRDGHTSCSRDRGHYRIMEGTKRNMTTLSVHAPALGPGRSRLTAADRRKPQATSATKGTSILHFPTGRPTENACFYQTFKQLNSKSSQTTQNN